MDKAIAMRAARRITRGALLPLIAAAAFGSLPAAADSVFFVNRESGGAAEDGRAWATAFARIQDAITAAQRAGGGEVWVAGGVYAETRPQQGALQLRANVRVYGGFAGTETAREQRDIQRNVTIIDGFRANAGAPAPTVVLGANNAVLDGFTVRGGRGPNGAGLFCNQNAPIIRNCLFVNNIAENFGGAVFNNDGAAPVFENCVFTSNEAGISGGAVANNNASPEFINCTFSLNFSADAGGAMLNTPGASVRIVGCTFTGNSSGQGGAIFTEDAAPLIEASVFIGNNTLGFGGALFNLDARPLIVNSVFANNQASERGGALANLGGAVDIINCTFTDNRADVTGGAAFNNETRLTVLNSILWNDQPNALNNVGIAPTVRFSNVSGGAGGQGNINANPRFAAPLEGDYRLAAGSPCLDAGASGGAPAADIRGVPRPQGNGVDMGAYEMDPDTLPDPGPGPGPGPDPSGCGTAMPPGANTPGGALPLLAAAALLLLAGRRQRTLGRLPA